MHLTKLEIDRMKKLLAIFPLLVAVSLAVPRASAQTPAATPSATTPDAAAATATPKKGKSTGVKKSSGRADSELADLSTKLTLTDDQKAKIKPIIDDKEAKIHTVKMAKSTSPDDQKAQNKVIRENANTQIRALLTADQQKTFDEQSKKGGKKAAAPPPAA
jgi:Spy/CpxP family protein refolding chaperone